jgi:hypothetical protein
VIFVIARNRKKQNLTAEARRRGEGQNTGKNKTLETQRNRESGGRRR